MPKYLIERDIPGLGNLTERDLQAIEIELCPERNHKAHKGSTKSTMNLKCLVYFVPS